jgi:hypothetical protein
LVIDESHSWNRKNGCGIYSSIDYPNIKKKIMLASLGAFGLTGGVISDSLSTNCRKRGFVSSAGMNRLAQTMPDANQIYILQHQN